MNRIPPIDLDAAEGKARTLLDGVKRSLGVTPNMMRALAHSPAALESCLTFSKTLGGGRLGPALGEQIALAVAGANGCEYCASAHTLLASKAGVGKGEAAENLEGRSGDAKTGAALRFARSLVAKRGFVDDAEVEAVRAAGFDDGAIAEMIAHVALNTFTNYFNHVAQTEVDFPRVAVGEPAVA